MRHDLLLATKEQFYDRRGLKLIEIMYHNRGEVRNNLGLMRIERRKKTTVTKLKKMKISPPPPKKWLSFERIRSF